MLVVAQAAVDVRDGEVWHALDDAGRARLRSRGWLTEGVRFRNGTDDPVRLAAVRRRSDRRVYPFELDVRLHPCDELVVTLDLLVGP